MPKILEAQFFLWDVPLSTYVSLGSTLQVQEEVIKHSFGGGRIATVLVIKVSLSANLPVKTRSPRYIELAFF